VKATRDEAALDEVYARVLTLLNSQGDHDVPVPLRQLAEVTDFKLLVALTPDGLLARALKLQRRRVDEVVHSIVKSAESHHDLQLPWKDRASAVSAPIEF